jgi:hypothetical protein
MSNQKFIWTNHAQKRLAERKIPDDYIIQTLTYPTKKIRKNNTTTEIQKQIDGKTVAVIVKKNKRGENLLVSCWINPPFPGTKDYKKRKRYLEMQHASFKKKLWLTFLTMIGL